LFFFCFFWVEWHACNTSTLYGERDDRQSIHCMCESMLSKDTDENKITLPNKGQQRSWTRSNRTQENQNTTRATGNGQKEIEWSEGEAMAREGQTAYSRLLADVRERRRRRTSPGDNNNDEDKDKDEKGMRATMTMAQAKDRSAGLARGEVRITEDGPSWAGGAWECRTTARQAQLQQQLQNSNKDDPATAHGLSLLPPLPSSPSSLLLLSLLCIIAHSSALFIASSLNLVFSPLPPPPPPSSSLLYPPFATL